jgi:hypothetical protein
MSALEIDYRINRRRMKRRSEESIKFMEKRAKEVLKEVKNLEKKLPTKEKEKVSYTIRRYKPLKDPTVYGRTRRYYRNYR